MEGIVMCERVKSLFLTELQTVESYLGILGGVG